MTRILIRMGFALDLSGATTGIGIGDAASFTFTASGGQAPYQLSVVSEDLPAEWTYVDNGDGTITVSTPASVSPGSFQFTIRVRDALRNEIERTYQVYVQPQPLALSGTLDDAEEGTPYSDALTITGGVSPYTLDTITGLPTGLSGAIAGATVAISGTPGAGTALSSPYSVYAQISDSDGSTADHTTSLVVDPPPGIIWNYITWTGNGSGARVLSTGVNMTGGGFVQCISTNSGNVGEFCAYSINGTSVFVHPGGLGNATAPTLDANYVFGTNSITVPPSMNANTIVYYAWVLSRSAGFVDVVTYTGNGLANHAINHSLGTTPGAFFTKTNAGAQGYHSFFGNARAMPWSAVGYPNSSAVAWSSTTPSSATFTVGTLSATNGNGVTFWAVLFAASGSDIACGGYLGNGNAIGPIQTVGFEPGRVEIYRIQAENYDQLRTPSFTGNESIYNGRANTLASADRIVLNSTTGWRPNTTNIAINQNGSDYAYIALKKP